MFYTTSPHLKRRTGNQVNCLSEALKQEQAPFSLSKLQVTVRPNQAALCICLDVSLLMTHERICMPVTCSHVLPCALCLCYPEVERGLAPPNPDTDSTAGLEGEPTAALMCSMPALDTRPSTAPPSRAGTRGLLLSSS